MEYISNNEYKINLNGQEVVVSAEDLKQAYYNVRKYEGTEINDYVETVPASYVYEQSSRFETLRDEIKGCGWKDIEWSDELDDALFITAECAMDMARDWYEHRYLMTPKF